MKVSWLAVLGGLVAMLGANAEMRDFTNNAGKVVKGELIQVEGSSAVLRLFGGRDVKVSIDTLAERDRAFIAAWWEENMLVLGGERRDYTNKEGKKVGASLISVDGEAAVLKLANDRDIMVPIDTLVDSDQEFIRKWWEKYNGKIRPSYLSFTVTPKTKSIKNTKPRKYYREEESYWTDGSKVDEINYVCELKSHIPKDISQITASYTIYKSVSKSNQTTIEKTDEIKNLPVLEARESMNFETVSARSMLTIFSEYDTARKTDKHEVLGISISIKVDGEVVLIKQEPENLDVIIKRLE